MTIPWKSVDTVTLVEWVCNVGRTNEDKEEILCELIQRPESEVIDELEHQMRNAPRGSWHPATHWIGAWRVADLLGRIGSPRAVRILLNELNNAGALWSYVEKPLKKVRDPQIAPAVRAMIPTRRVQCRSYQFDLALILGHQGDNFGPTVLMEGLSDRDAAGSAISCLKELLQQAPECFTDAQLRQLAELPAVEAIRFTNPYAIAEDIDVADVEIVTQRYQHEEPTEVRDLAHAVLATRST